MSEILNIDYHKKQLVLKALRAASNHNDAAKRLGISRRTLFTLKIQYGISTKYIRAGSIKAEIINT